MDNKENITNVGFGIRGSEFLRNGTPRDYGNIFKITQIQWFSIYLFDKLLESQKHQNKIHERLYKEIVIGIIVN